MVNKKSKLKSKKQVLPCQVIKFKMSWWIKLCLWCTWPLWIIPFLISNLVLGSLLRNYMQNFQRTGTIKHPQFNQVALNTLDFYNTAMLLQNSPKLVIDEAMWKLMNPQDVTITTFDDLPLAAFLFVNHQPNNNHKWIIATHGWQQNRYSILYLVKHFYDQGYSIVTYDARSHGSNKHSAVTFGQKEAIDLYTVIRYVNNYIQQTDFNYPISISLIGNSMGATTILQTISQFEVKSLGVKSAIVDCGYDDFSKMIKILGTKYFGIHYLWFYFGVKFIFQQKDKFNIKSINVINKLQNCADFPVLFIHGDLDETVPVAMATNMYQVKISYEMIPNMSKLLIVVGALHVRSINKDYHLYCQTTLKFVQKWTSNSSTAALKIKNP